MGSLGVVVLAAGLGKRMCSSRAKVLHHLGGKPLIRHVLRTAQTLCPERLVVVVGHQAGEVQRVCAGEGVLFVRQREQRGTGDAVRAAEGSFAGFAGDVLLICGDVPLLTPATLSRLVYCHRDARAVLSLLTVRLEDPTGYGRIIRGENGRIQKIVEERDASAQEKQVQEINPGIFCVRRDFLFPALQRLQTNNAQGEYYLTDIVAMAVEGGGQVQTILVADPLEVAGVNSQEELAHMERALQEKIRSRWMTAGVTLEDPDTVYIDEEVVIGRDTVIGPNTHLKGQTLIGEGCRIDGSAYVTDTRLSKGVHLRFSVVLDNCEVGEGVEVGPFAYLKNKKEPGILSTEQPLYVGILRPKLDDKVGKLIEGGARILKPDTVTIGPEVELENIVAKGLIVYPETKIFGEKTLILGGVEIGYEEPVTLENAALGENVSIKGGYIKDSVLLDGCEVRQGFHAREDCLLEEYVYCAHNVGIKMTIAFPFVVMGSLINFCDCLIAGGTSRDNHTEIGSGFIHFNYSPRGDKATPSLFGDVPKGVMLNQPPIFLGGLCGVVGPFRVGFGSILSAGEVYRSEYGEGLLVMGEDFPTGSKSHDPRRLGSIRRKIFNNMLYIANLAALWSWYRHVRTLSGISNSLRARLINAALETIDANIQERVKQLDRFRELVAESIQQLKLPNNSDIGAATIMEQQEFVANWDFVKPIITEFKIIQGGVKLRERFCESVIQSLSGGHTEYVTAIQSLSASDANIGTRWLNSIVDDFMSRVCEVMPQNLKNMSGESSHGS